ncbi:MAG: peptide deformylase [Lachnospiraceae bacterium]|nr:peptide deformylase [Lachnospiraceae bacterium]
MVREIVKDTEVLSRKCKTVGKKDDVSQVIQDLKDTAAAYEKSHDCVGLAANQIGYDKKVIICNLGHPKVWQVMINPVIAKASNGWHMSEEGCLSLEGVRTVKRHDEVLVIYKDERGKMQQNYCSGLTADIVQHEIDHLNGRLI